MLTNDMRAIRRFWKPDGKRRPANEKTIKAWMKDKKVDTILVSAFLYFPDYEKQRKRMVRDLDIGLKRVKNPRSAKALRNFLNPKGKIDKTNDAKIRSAMRKMGVKEKTITNFLYNPVLQQHHPKLIKVLKLTGAA